MCGCGAALSRVNWSFRDAARTLLNGSVVDSIEETAKKPVRNLKCKYHNKGFSAHIVLKLILM